MATCPQALELRFGKKNTSCPSNAKGSAGSPKESYLE
jgi:hypothetical protein